MRTSFLRARLPRSAHATCSPGPLLAGGAGVAFRPSSSSLNAGRTHINISTPPRRLISRRTFASELDLEGPPEEDTIFALSTPPGKAGVGVIRISGDAVERVWDAMVFRTTEPSEDAPSEPLPRARTMVYRQFRVPLWGAEDAGQVIDEGLVVYFPAQSSFTSKPTLELHSHSSISVIAKLLSALSSVKGCRPADRGEFTRQAFLAGRMDLTEVEGLKDLIDAETDGQRKLARSQVGGVLRERYERLREEIIGAMSIAEALIDFGEDDNIGDEVLEDARKKVISLAKKIHGHLKDNRGEIMQSGVKVAIFGPPNAGKSSLLNHLSQRDAAIVSSVPGTTRDVVSVSLDLAGNKVTLSDTAGLRETDDDIENIGVERAAEEIANADISLLVLALPTYLYPWVDPKASLSLILPHITKDTLILFNQTDLVPPTHTESIQATATRLVTEIGLPRGVRWAAGSVATGEGLTEFLDETLVRAVQSKVGLSTDEPPLIINVRHRHHLSEALDRLQWFLDQPSDNVVLATEALREAAQEIAKVSGTEIGVEDVLDRLFGDFCIGK